MRKILNRITITTVFSVFILLQTSSAQSNIGHPPLVHPGIMMTIDQLDLMRDRINNGIEPQASAFDTLKIDPRAAKDYEPNYIHFDWTAGERDAQACWVQGLMWAITQEEVYAENVLKIMDAYSTLESVTGGHIELSIGLMGTMFMRGAEIVKHTYSGWDPEIEEAFMDMYDKAFMPALLTRVEHENNWMASITESLMASAIFKDDRELFDLAVYRLKIYLPTNIPFEDGTPAELWRDIAHAQEGIGALVQTAEMAWNQGIDAYGWLDNRMAKGMEYLAEVIETEDDRFEKNYLLPVGWDVVYNHYHHRMGMDLPWSYKLVQTIRPEGLIRHTSLGTLIKGDMDKDIPLAISHWRLPLAYKGASYSDSLTRYGCTSPVEWVVDETTPMPSALNISSDGQITGNVEADSGAYKIILKSSGASCDSLSTTYYLPVTTMLPAVEANVTEPGLWYEYRTPNFDTDPGLDSFESIVADSTSSFSFSVATDETYAIRFSGYLDVPTDGAYCFQVGTQNQSRLYIDDQLVVDHWMIDNRARIAWDQLDSEIGLKAGKHKIVLTVNNGNYHRGLLYGDIWPDMEGMLEVQWKLPASTSYVSIPQSAFSIDMTMTSNDVTPDYPSDLKADSISSSQIDLSWTDNADNESGYEIQRKGENDEYTIVATVGANITSYSDTGLVYETAYTYRVLAFNTAYSNIVVGFNALNYSDYSNEAMATTGLNTTGLFTYNASDDAYVRGGSHAEENFGTTADLVVKQGTNSDFFRKSLIKFNLEAARFGTANVGQATLKLYANSVSACTITASEADDNWTESDVTWATAPTVGNSISSTAVSSAGTYYTWDVTSYIKSQLDVDKIISFSLDDLGADNAQVIFNSREAGENVPELIIDTDVSSALPRISEDAHQQVSIYPNPLTSDVLSIDLVGFKSQCNVDVVMTNLMGQVLFNENIQAKDCIKIDTRGVLTTGVYWVSVTEGEYVSASKLIIQ